MPYVIALVIIIVAAGALLLFRQPAEAPVAPVVEEVVVEEVNRVPEGFTPPSGPPPNTQPVMPPAVSEIGPAPDTTDNAPTTTAEPAATTRTFVAEASYFTPRRTEHEMVITFDLDGEIVSDVSIDYDGAPAVTPAHTGFDNAYKAEVVGANINEIDLSRVGGASLTSVAFNEAVADVRAQL